ncbi:MAG: hypothetical protein ACTSUE_05695, partial [Promethearchaeota archaeon]
METFEDIFLKLNNLIKNNLESEKLEEIITLTGNLAGVVAELKAELELMEQAVDGLNLGKVFKEEIDLLNQIIFDNFLPVTKTVEILCSKYADETDSDAKDFPAIVKSKISTMQKRLSTIIEKTPKKMIKLENLVKINEKLIPAVEDIGVDQSNAIKDVKRLVTTFTSVMDSLKAFVTELISSNSELAVFDEKINSLNALLEDERKINVALKEKISLKDREIESLLKRQDELRKEMEGEANKNLAKKLAVLKDELKELALFLEESPKFQIAHLVNNINNCTLGQL